LYSCLRSLFSATAAFLIGALILGIDPFQGVDWPGVPVYPVQSHPDLCPGSFIRSVGAEGKGGQCIDQFNAVGRNLPDGNLLPDRPVSPLLRLLALLFPPTWMTNGVRSALLGLNYFFQEWYLDLAVLWAFALITPLLGYWIFTRAETSIRRNEGVGQF
jgi:hypothetical protein